MHKALQSYNSKSNLAKIKNKYLFFEVFSYSDTRFNVLSMLFKSCAQLRFLLLQNWQSLSSGLFSKIRYTINQAQSESITKVIMIKLSSELYGLPVLAKMNTVIKIDLRT